MIPRGAHGYAGGNARMYHGRIVGRTSETPALASDVLYSARIDPSYGESIGVVNAYPDGGRPVDRESWNLVGVVPCKIGDPCLFFVSSGRPVFVVLTEAIAFAPCPPK